MTDVSREAAGAGWIDAARTVAGFGSVLPSVGAGLAVWAMTGDRRRAIDCTTSLFGDLGTAMAGLQLEVDGAENLEAAGPSVVLFNHQSEIDALLVCALLRRNFVGVAKQEVRLHPLMGPAFQFAGTVFIDRSDREKAIAAMEPAVATLRDGTSIVVFPEGTRSESGELGPFKKGAFRIAMAAGAPLLPVVIHDAGERLPKGAWVTRAGRVRMSVLPPIPTRDWCLEDLPKRIESVHRLYRRALGAPCAERA